MSKFFDGLQSLTRSLINQRNVSSTNRVTHARVDNEELRAIYRTGLGSKIIRLKAGIALDDTLQFESVSDKDWYDANMAAHVKKLAKYMLAFGRGLLVVHEPGGDLSQPLKNLKDVKGVRYHVFSGDLVYVQSVNFDLSSADYFKPRAYNVRSATIHPSRVVDFKYYEPVELDAPEYQFGGISEFELIRDELVADGVVQRAVPAVLEKSSTLFYKIKGFKALLQDKRESEVLAQISAIEHARSAFGAGILDQEDMIETHSQALANLAESDMITLRRLAMVTGLPLSWLVGEAAKGLNSTGEGERQVMMQTISTLQSDYLIEPINRIMKMHSRSPVTFQDNQGQTDDERIEYETKAVQNALVLWQIGEDYKAYLEERNVIPHDDFDEFFTE